MRKAIGRVFARLGCSPAVIAALVAIAWQASLAAAPVDYVVQVSAQVQTSPPQITLQWAAPTVSASGYTIYRMNFGGTAWGSAIASLSGSAMSYTDTNVAVGSAYEYQIIRTGADTAYGYIYAGIQAPLIEARGTIVLIVDNTFSTALSAQLSVLEQDLVGDGWTIIRHDVSRTASVPSIKALIQADYAGGGVNAVFLFGHVPVPYSGNIAPDGHADHQGAWPADGFYADMTGTWTDTTVNNSISASSRNWNVPGDGKYDQSTFPANLVLQVGRVDLDVLPSFSLTEQQLLSQYLTKDHNFRNALLSVCPQGIINDNFGDLDGEEFASNGWRNYAPMFGAANTQAAGIFSVYSGGTSLCAYGCGDGAYNTCAGVGSTSSFASGDPGVVFYMFIGSYFGDWDQSDDFLRAPLATSTYGLTSCWVGRPYWYFQHMALGLNIGYGTRLSQNNSGLYSPTGNYAREVHMGLMGDPTLRLQPVAPPCGLTATLSSGAFLQWTASPDGTVLGYNIYRSSNPLGPYTRLNSGLQTGTYYDDAGVTTQTYYYMVRAVKLQESGSGTYYNASQGVFTSVNTGAGAIPTAPTSLAATAGNAQVSLVWNTSPAATSYNVKCSAASGGPYQTIASVFSANYVNINLVNGTPYYYVVTGVNSYGESAISNQACGTPANQSLPPPWVDNDVGSVGLCGSATYSNGTFTIKGSGADIWDPADAFHYVYQPLNGNGQIVARVDSVQNTNMWAKAGVMIRTDLTATAQQASVVVTPGSGVAFQRRVSTGGSSSNTAGANVTAPYWVKLVRSGSTFTAYQSSDGNTWSQIGTDTIGMPTSVYIGLAVTAHNNSALCLATIDNVTVTSSGTPAAPTLTAIAPSSATAGGAGFTLTLTGTNFTSAAIVNWQGQANLTPVTQTSIQLTVAVPASYIAGAGTANVTETDAGGTTAAQVFTVNSGTSPAPTLTAITPASATAGGAGFTLTLTGTNFTAAAKVNWQGQANLTPVTQTSTQLTVAVPAGYIAGAGTANVTETDAGGTTAARVFTVNTPGLPSPWVDQDVGSVGAAGSAAYANGVFTVKGSGADIWGNADAFNYVYQPISGNCQIVARVDTITNTDPWAKAGVMIRSDLTAGAQQAMVAVTSASGVAFQRRVTENGVSTNTAGANVTAPYWVKLTLSGGTLTAYQSVDGNTWTQFGTDTLSLPTSLYIGLAVTAHKAGLLNTSTLDNVVVTGSGTPPPAPTLTAIAPSSATAGGAGFTMTLTGTNFTSAAIVNWQGQANLTPATQTSTQLTVAVPASYIASAGTANVAVTDVGGTTAAQVFTVNSMPPPPPSGTLPSPWVDQDIGSVTAAGSASYANGVFTVKGAGSDIWDAADSFNYAYQPMSGNGQIVARVVSVGNTNMWAKAGVMIRSDLTAGAQQALVAVSYSCGVAFQRRVAENGVSTNTAGANVTAPYWVKLVRSGSTFTAYQSVDGNTWVLVGTDTINMATSVYVGLAVTAHGDGCVNTSTFDNVTH